VVQISNSYTILRANVTLRSYCTGTLACGTNNVPKAVADKAHHCPERRIDERVRPAVVLHGAYVLFGTDDNP